MRLSTVLKSEMDRKEIGLRINYFRNRKGYSATHLSHVILKSDSYIAKVENGDFNVSAEGLLEILSMLDVEPEEFFAKDYRNYMRDKELYARFDELTPDQRGAVYALINSIKK